MSLRNSASCFLRWYTCRLSSSFFHEIVWFTFHQTWASRVTCSGKFGIFLEILQQTFFEFVLVLASFTRIELTGFFFSKPMTWENILHFATRPRWFSLEWTSEDLLQPIKSTTQIRIVTRHQYGIWKWRNDRRSERNLCNCIKKPEKKIQDFKGVWTRDLAIDRCDALPTELWSHWRWEQVNCGFICSRERNEC